MARRHQTLIPLSHEHHDGLMLAWRLRNGDLAAREPELKIKHAVIFFETRLVAHFGAEEQKLFPAVRPFLATDGAILDSLVQEHRELASKAAALKGGDLGELIPFCDLLERHIRTEERQLFPLIEQWLDADTLASLGPEIKAILAFTPSPSGAPGSGNLE